MNTLFTKVLGTTVQVTLKQYGDGTSEYTAAGKTVRSSSVDAETFRRGLMKALNTVA